MASPCDHPRDHPHKLSRSHPRDYPRDHPRDHPRDRPRDRAAGAEKNEAASTMQKRWGAWGGVPLDGARIVRYRGISLVRNIPLLGPYSRAVSRIL